MRPTGDNQASSLASGEAAVIAPMMTTTLGPTLIVLSLVSLLLPILLSASYVTLFSLSVLLLGTALTLHDASRTLRVQFHSTRQRVAHTLKSFVLDDALRCIWSLEDGALGAMTASLVGTAATYAFPSWLDETQRARLLQGALDAAEVGVHGGGGGTAAVDARELLLRPGAVWTLLPESWRRALLMEDDYEESLVLGEVEGAAPLAAGNDLSWDDSGDGDANEKKGQPPIPPTVAQSETSDDDDDDDDDTSTTAGETLGSSSSHDASSLPSPPRVSRAARSVAAAPSSTPSLHGTPATATADARGTSRRIDVGQRGPTHQQQRHRRHPPREEDLLHSVLSELLRDASQSIFLRAAPNDGALRAASAASIAALLVQLKCSPTARRFVRHALHGCAVVALGGTAAVACGTWLARRSVVASMGLDGDDDDVDEEEVPVDGEAAEVRRCRRQRDARNNGRGGPLLAVLLRATKERRVLVNEAKEELRRRWKAALAMIVFLFLGKMMRRRRLQHTSSTGFR